MSKQKVRPMVDKDLRDEVIKYCGGGESFNSALRYYAKGKSRAEHFANIFRSKAKTQEAAVHSLHGQVKYRDRKIIELKQEVANLHNEKVNLEKWSSGVVRRNTSLLDEIIELKKTNAELSTTLEGTRKAYDSIFELYMEKKDRGFIYFCLGNAIGAAVMTFVFNVM